ncbi:MAG: PspC domain-containing protein [Oscillospiraceae bacterium]|jgi:phage shock protein C|nr:PspC domain-containing protein [Oscillospiraceae bacterium]
MDLSNKKLYRSATDKKLCGVLGGLAQYFSFDVTALRVLYVVVSIFSACFPGILVYIILWMIIPEEPAAGSGQYPPPPQV